MHFESQIMLGHIVLKNIDVQRNLWLQGRSAPKVATQVVEVKVLSWDFMLQLLNHTWDIVYSSGRLTSNSVCRCCLEWRSVVLRREWMGWVYNVGQLRVPL